MSRQQDACVIHQVRWDLSKKHIDTTSQAEIEDWMDSVPFTMSSRGASDELKIQSITCWAAKP